MCKFLIFSAVLDGSFWFFVKAPFLFRQTPFIHNPKLPIDLCPVAHRHRPFFRGFKSCQIQGLHKSCIAWKNAPLAVGFPVSGIERFDCICRIDHLPDSCGKLEDRGYCIPVILPPFHAIRIFRCPFLRHTFKGFQCFFSSAA